MSNQQEHGSRQSGLSRRQFVKTALWGVAAGTVGGRTLPAYGGLFRQDEERSAPATLPPSEMVAVQVHDVILARNADYGIVVLRDDQERYLPIWIGRPEAQSIQIGLRGIPMPRPMTHDFVTTLLESAALRPQRVVITQLRDMTYYAQFIVRTAKDAELVLDSRPSDAIAVAVRTGTPLFAAKALMEVAALNDSELKRLEPGYIA